MRTVPFPTAQAARWATALLVVAVTLLSGADTVSAHTDFVSSEPADGATVEAPIASVVVNFTNPAVESGDGFQLLTPDGSVRLPSSVVVGDGTSFEAVFEPPLSAGTYGFRWEVQAGDAHPIDGSFSFEVTLPPGASTTAPTTTASATTAPAAGAATSTAPTADDADPPADGAAPTDAGSETLDRFLAGGSDPEPFAGRAGRTLSMAGSLFALGVVAALMWVIRGTRDELRALLQWVRLAGVALAAGGVIELGALDEASGVPLGEVLTTKAGIAVLLDLVAGVLLVVGFAPGSGRMLAIPQALSAAVSDVVGPSVETNAPDGATRRWAPDRTAAVGLAGVLLALAAYWFDGHTVTRGPWALHAAINLVHVASAGLWAGGVVAMTLIVVGRRRRGVAADAAGLVVRFSSIAGASLALLTVAGAGLAWLVLDGPGELFSSEWGRTLLVKVTAVAIAASLGAYNHLKLRPALERHPDDEVLAGHLRTSLLIESMVLAVVVVLTAILVAAGV